MSNCNPAGPSESLGGCSSGDQGCRSVAHTTFMPEATVSGNISCSNPGANGWCIGSATLNISSNEPMAGFSILSVEGTRNGATFACSGSSCSVPLSEGNNDFSFWALSSWGDSSGMGSASGGVDTQPPLVSGQLSGVTGDGGWFVSSVSATASAGDATSGIGSVVYSLDGGPQTAYPGAVTLGDGSHTIVFTARDRAGNSSSVSLSASVDTGLPSVAIDSPSGTLGDNGWYVSGTTLGASAGDAGSGLASLEYSLDGGLSTAYTGSVSLPDGVNTIVFTATDHAGNSASRSATVNVDTTAPQLTLNAFNAFCPACNERLAIDYVAADNGSGVTEWTLLDDGITLANGVAAEGGTFEWDGSGLTPGAHTLSLQAKDLAGNVTQTQMIVTLATPTPTPRGLNIPILKLPLIIHPVNPLSTNTATPNTQSGGGGQPTSSSTAAAPTATRTNSIIVAMGNPAQRSNAGQSISNPAATNPLVPNAALFGAEAAAVIGAATGIALDQKRKREEEEAKAAAGAAQFNAVQAFLEQARQAFDAMMKQAENLNIPPDKLEEYRKQFYDEGDYSAAIGGLHDTMQPVLNANERDYLTAMEHNDQAKAWIEANPLKYSDKYQAELAEEQAQLQEQIRKLKEDMASHLGGDYLPAMDHSPEAKEWIIEHADELLAKYQEQLAELERIRKENLASQLGGDFFQAMDHSPAAKQWIIDHADEMMALYQRDLQIQQAFQDAQKAYQDAQKALELARTNDPILRAFKWFDTNVIQNIEKMANATGTAWVVLPAMAIAIANIAPWYGNIESNPAMFDGVHMVWAQEVNALKEQYPSIFADAATTRQTLLSNPLEAFSGGTAVANVLMDTIANYGNAIWQQDPMVQYEVTQIQAMAGENCPSFLGDAMVRRCEAGYSLAAGWAYSPFDTAEGVINSVLINPVEGIDKAGIYLAQNAFLGGGFKDGGNALTQDRQILSGEMFLFFILLAAVFAPAALVGGGILFGLQTSSSVAALDQQIQSAATSADVMRIASRRSTRVFVATSVFIFGLLAMGGVKLTQEGVNWVNFRGSLSDNQLITFSDLSLGDQLELANTAKALGTSPEGIGFYLDEYTKNGSPFQDISITDGLKISELAAKSGKEGYVSHLLRGLSGDNGALAALRDVSPEGLKYYINNSSQLNSGFEKFPVEYGLRLSSIAALNGADAIQPLLDAEVLPGDWKSYIPEKYLPYVVPSFANAGIAIKTTSPLIVYRYWGPDGETGSPYFSFDPSMNPITARSLLALPDYNMAINVSEFIIPENTTIIFGDISARPDFGTYATGGGIQIYLPNPNDAIWVGRVR